MNVPHADGRPLEPYRFALTRVTDDANLAESLRRVAEAGCELVNELHIGERDLGRRRTSR